MATFELQRSRHPSQSTEDTFERTGLRAVSRVPTSVERDIFDRYRTEIDQYCQEMALYRDMDLSEVLVSISGTTARLAAIRIELQRMGSQKANRLRTSEVDPLLDALELQFKIHSRRQAVLQMEFEMTRGM